MTTCTISSSTQDYRAAVALNNMGVTLLERGCLRDAMMNFKDGLSFLRSSRGDLQQQQDESLRRSSRCLASSSATTELDIDFELTALSHDDQPEAFVSAAINDLQTSNSSFVLRLGWEDCEEVDTKVHYTASILHNYAVACQIQSMTCKSKSKKARKLRERAHKATVTANGILSFHMETAVNGLASSSERTLILWMLNVKEMMKLARAAGDMNKARKYCCDLAFLRSQYEEEEYVLLGEQRATAAAAA